MELYPFQIEGRDFLASRKRAVLGDEMGLGKTPQGVCAMRELGAETSLTFCPKIVKTGWQRQMRDWEYSEDVFIVETGKDVIPKSAKNVIVNYDLGIVPAILEQLKQRRFDVLNLDEIQRLKSPNSARSKAILGGAQNALAARADRIYGYTGTFMPNGRPIEMYLALMTMAPELLGPYVKVEEFGKRFCKGYFDGRAWDFSGASNLTEFAEMVKPFFLRREMKDVLPDLPPVIASDLYFDVGDIGREIDGEIYLTDETNTNISRLRNLIGDAKVPHVMNYIIGEKLNRNFDGQGIEKLVLFAYHKSVIDATVNCLSEVGIKALTIDGRVNSRDREHNKEQFIYGDCRVLVLQHQAAGEAVDGLQLACHDMLDIEPDWSNGIEDQLVGRLKRIGQRFPIRFERAIAESTFDGAVVGTQYRKRRATKEFYNTIQMEKTEMSIETSLERIAAALEKMVGQGVVTHAPTESQVSKEAAEAPKTKGKNNKKDEPAAAVEQAGSASASTPAPAVSSTPAQPASGLTINDVREVALVVLNDIYKGSDEGKAAISQLAVKPFGASELVKLDPQHFEAAIAALKAHIAEKSAAPKDALAGI